MIDRWSNEEGECAIDGETEAGERIRGHEFVIP